MAIVLLRTQDWLRLFRASGFLGRWLNLCIWLLPAKKLREVAMMAAAL
jgi:hypothetical protein